MLRYIQARAYIKEQKDAQPQPVEQQGPAISLLPDAIFSTLIGSILIPVLFSRKFTHHCVSYMHVCLCLCLCLHLTLCLYLRLCVCLNAEWVRKYLRGRV
jgi:hypothetical protein